MAPIVQSSAEVDNNAAKLRARRQELVKEIESAFYRDPVGCFAMTSPQSCKRSHVVSVVCTGIDEGVKKLAEKKASLQREVNDQEALFKARSSALEDQNRGLSALVARSEAVPAIVDSLVGLRSDLTHEKCALKVSSKVPNAAATVVAARASFTNAALVYLQAEKRCLAFLRQRLAAARTEVNKLAEESSRLGMCHRVPPVPLRRRCRIASSAAHSLFFSSTHHCVVCPQVDAMTRRRRRSTRALKTRRCTSLRTLPRFVRCVWRHTRCCRPFDGRLTAPRRRTHYTLRNWRCTTASETLLLRLACSSLPIQRPCLLTSSSPCPQKV